MRITLPNRSLQADQMVAEIDLGGFAAQGRGGYSERIRFAIPNEASKWRVDTFFSKEPETLEWISSFRSDEVLVDVGANVGMYSVFAAAYTGVTVIALEPESQNYALLNRNIFLNNLSEKIVAFPYAVSQKHGTDLLHLSSWGAAGSCHAAGEAVGFDGNTFRPAFSQGVITISLDTLLAGFRLPPNCHLKIDVDGLEDEVIFGSRALLERNAFSSVLVEINSNLSRHLQIVNYLTSLGYVYSKEQVARSERKSGRFAGCANYVFRRQ